MKSRENSTRSFLLTKVDEVFNTYNSNKIPFSSWLKDGLNFARKTFKSVSNWQIPKLLRTFSLFFLVKKQWQKFHSKFFSMYQLTIIYQNFLSIYIRKTVLHNVCVSYRICIFCPIYKIFIVRPRHSVGAFSSSSPSQSFVFEQRSLILVFFINIIYTQYIIMYIWDANHKS